MLGRNGAVQKVFIKILCLQMFSLMMQSNGWLGRGERFRLFLGNKFLLVLDFTACEGSVLKYLFFQFIKTAHSVLDRFKQATAEKVLIRQEFVDFELLIHVIN